MNIKPEQHFSATNLVVIPAIDLRGGRCVRLQAGSLDFESVYNTDPVAQAQQFETQGASMLHIVDLDGAFNGRQGNLESIERIRQHTNLVIQLGGGLRSVEDVERIFDAGIQSVIIGTMAIKAPQILLDLLAKHHPQRFQLGVDARSNQVMIDGWTNSSGQTAQDFAQYWRKQGIEQAIFTDIETDGMLSGPNLSALSDFAENSGMQVTASGGVSTIADIQSLATIPNVNRVIIGKALYENKLNLEEVISAINAY